MTNKAVGYIRVITEERNAIDEQKRYIENAVYEYGYELLEIYIDKGRGGASLERSGIKKLLEDARNNRIDIVLIYDAQVLSTDIDNTSELLELLSALNVHVFSVSEKRFMNSSTSDTLNNLSRKVYNTLSEMEHNGINLQDEIKPNGKTIKKDPSARLQNEIIDAYLRMKPDNRPQV